MTSIFKKDDNFVDKPNRNTFDLSFQNNLSLKFGKLIPCMCQEVLPGDSFQIKPTFGLRYLPQVFPVQTRMRAHLHFFYVRNRTIWKDWMDFVGKTKENLVVPYLKTNITSSEVYDGDPSYQESSIYDYMGLPVVLDLDTNDVRYELFTNKGYNKSVIINPDNIENLTSEGATYSYIGSDPTKLSATSPQPITANTNYRGIYREFHTPINFAIPSAYGQNIEFKYKTENLDSRFVTINLVCQAYSIVQGRYINITVPLIDGGSVGYTGVLNTYFEYGESSRYYITKIYGYFLGHGDADDVVSASNISVSVQVLPKYNRNYPFAGLSAYTLPYGDGDWQYRINALPFRAYEAVYNSFYRNAENNPFKINGVPEYNRYVKSIDGGPQFTSDFKLFNRNWEDDAFTTAVPTPQQGNAPRVGLTGNPNEPLALRVYDQDGNISTVNLVANDNGQITVAEGFSGDTNTLVNALNDAVNFGITINDLRNVNSLQLWLEKNVRKGYKYRDQMLSHYGVAIDYDDLMIPEFIGGVSRDVTVNQISQTVETADGNLGDMAGQAYVVGDGESIRHYCPEHGYIIGIVSVVPVPNYSQMIPKHFFKHDTFDYFFPEFGKIGMQPITKKEIASTASWLTHTGDETFGYQRAWYDYLANVDQVHGKFNSDFYNFLIQRKFDSVPELGEDFTTVKNEDLNSIFYTDSDEDKILGQIYFDIKAIRPIPLFGIPSLE